MKKQEKLDIIRRGIATVKWGCRYAEVWQKYLRENKGNNNDSVF